MILVVILLIVFAIWRWFERNATELKGRPPGPLQFPFIGNMIQVVSASSYPAVAFNKLSKKYGPIMSIRIGAINAILLSDPDIMKEIQNRNEVQGRNVMDVLFDRNFEKNLGIIFSHGEVWKTMRPFCVRNLRDFGFGKSSSMDKIISSEVAEFSTVLKERVRNTGGIIHVDGLFTMSILNIIWSLATGERFSHDDPKLRRLLHLSDEMLRSTNFAASVTIAYPFLRKYFPGLSGKNRQMYIIRAIHEFMRDTIREYEKHEGRKSDPQNFVEKFINQMEAEKDNPESFFTEECLIIILMDFFQAGSDTSASVLCFAILYLMLHPNVQKAMQKEIDEIVPKGSVPSLSHKPSLIYTQATVYEILRWCTVVPIPAARTVTQDFYYKGFLFKEGTDVMSNIYSVCSNKDYWGDPKNFRPERFIKKDGTLNNALYERMLIFSSGPRLCLADTLALNEIFLFLATLMQQMTFKRVPGQPTPSTKPNLGIIHSPCTFDVLIEIRN